VNGTCGIVCTGGTTNCSGKCVDVKIDALNCGLCGKACTAGQICNNGTCQLLCSGGTTNCNGLCVDVKVDPNNCGTCGKVCTTGQTCTNSVCTASGCQNPVPTTLFSEGFANNSQGWTLGTEWQVAAAKVSIGGYGNPDPATDHTLGTDNGVAGVVIGGNPSTTKHRYYMTSPIINAAGATKLYLGFWRWLNSDYLPYMQNSVEVFNGSSWVVVWQSGSYPAVQDAAWSQQSFDISAHANANLRVRFGHMVGSAGVFTVSSWNVDDVTVTKVTCN
jgi:hypothetical protein